MFDGGLVSIDTNGSIATDHSPAIVSLKSLHVQDKGTFELKAYHDAYTWNIDATTILVRVFAFVLNYLFCLIIYTLLANSSSGN